MGNFSVFLFRKHKPSTTSPSLFAPLTRSITPVPLPIQKSPSQGWNIAHLPLFPDSVQHENATGLPNTLKIGIERLSGLSLDDVRVHYNSQRPAHVGALAYTQGTEIHVGPGQEQHLAHEAWHVVQQKKGRVQPMWQMKGVEINDDGGLEKEADMMGSRAMTQHSVSSVERPRTTVRKAATVHALKSAVVQRNIGYEFELDPTIRTYQRGLFGGYKPLSKRARILNGTHFYVEADRLPGGDTSWEFVTDAFPETIGGLNTLVQTLRQIDGVVSLLRAGVAQNAAHNPVNQNFAAFGNPVRNRYFTKGDPVVRTKPQVTAGLSLAALDALFHSATHNPGVGVSNLMRDVNSVNETGQLINGSVPDTRLRDMRAEAGNAIGGGPAADPSLRALVTQLMQVIIAGQANIGATPKTVMRLALGRTDLKATFDTLPPLIRGPYEANPANFVTLVLNAVNNYRAGLNPPQAALNNNQSVISGNLFSHPQFANDPLHNTPSPFTQVTINQWLTNIATPGGQDLLSHGHYPVRRHFGVIPNRTDKKANQLLGSMGAMHNQLDPGNLPIFEIRSSARILASLITPYALDFFKYIHVLNSPPGLHESAFLTGLGINNTVDIASYHPQNRPVLLQGLTITARNDFNS